MAGEFEMGMTEVNAGLGTAQKVADLGKTGVDIWHTIESINMAKRQERESTRQFDQKFNEDVRRYGLEFALNDFATRKGISLQQAQSIMNAQQLKNQTAMNEENIKTSALGRRAATQQMQWQAEDRSNKTKFGKAVTKGFVTGLLGGK